jgi:hypothetical protein
MLMRKTILFFCCWTALQLNAQDKSLITVRGSEVNNGVVIVTVHQASPTEGKASFVLQCNKGVSDCKVPELGNYVMVRLPKNYGMYDCANVDLYPSSADPETSKKIGEYCLVDK